MQNNKKEKMKKFKITLIIETDKRGDTYQMMTNIEKSKIKGIKSINIKCMGGD